MRRIIDQAPGGVNVGYGALLPGDPGPDDGACLVSYIDIEGVEALRRKGAPETLKIRLGREHDAAIVASVRSYIFV